MRWILKVVILIILVNLLFWYCCNKLMKSLAHAQPTYAQKICKTGILPSIGGDIKVKCIKIKSRFVKWEDLVIDEKVREMTKKANRTNKRLYWGDSVFLFEREFEWSMYIPHPINILPAGHKQLIFDPKDLSWAVYDEKGDLVKWGFASGGKNYCKDIERSCKTPIGKFRIITKKGRYYRSHLYPIDCEGKECVEMPYYVRFHYEGAGFHASKDLPGFNASHGCIRMTMEDAKWLNGYVDDDTIVEIKPYK